MRLFKRKEIEVPIPTNISGEPIFYDKLPKASDIVDIPQEEIEPTKTEAQTIAKTVPSEINELEEQEKQIPQQKFIEQDAYDDLTQKMMEIEGNIRNSQAIIDEMNNIKNEGDKQLEEWRSTLEDVERKLLYIDKVLFEKQ